MELTNYLLVIQSVFIIYRVSKYNIHIIMIHRVQNPIHMFIINKVHNTSTVIHTIPDIYKLLTQLTSLFVNYSLPTYIICVNIF